MKQKIKTAINTMNTQQTCNMRVSTSYSPSTATAFMTPPTTSAKKAVSAGLSQSISSTSELKITTTPPVSSNYRNIKARYFSSLNLSSPIKSRMMEEQMNDILDESNSTTTTTTTTTTTIITSSSSYKKKKPAALKTPAVPIPIPIKSSMPARKRSESDEEGFVSSSSTSPVESITPLSSATGAYTDDFLFGEMDATYANTPQFYKGKFKQTRSMDDYADDESDVTPTQFLPPHLLNKRSDFSLYQHEKKIQIQKKLKQLNI